MMVAIRKHEWHREHFLETFWRLMVVAARKLVEHILFQVETDCRCFTEAEGNISSMVNCDYKQDAG
jgi:hypothetical protein